MNQPADDDNRSMVAVALGMAAVYGVALGAFITWLVMR